MVVKNRGGDAITSAFLWITWPLSVTLTMRALAVFLPRASTLGPIINDQLLPFAGLFEALTFGAFCRRPRPCRLVRLFLAVACRKPEFRKPLGETPSLSRGNQHFHVRSRRRQSWLGIDIRLWP